MEFTFFSHWRQSRLQRYPDPVLCEECLAGNEEAWGALLARYQNLIYSIPLKFQLSAEEAADIFQAVALDLYTGLENLRDREKLQGWLISVTRHRCLRYKSQRDLAPLSDEELDEVLMEIPDQRAEGEDWLLEIEEESLLRAAIARLSERCRELIRWLFYSDPPPEYTEVARRLGVARNSVGFIRERCLARLRGELEKEGFGKQAPKKESVASGGGADG